MQIIAYFYGVISPIQQASKQLSSEWQEFISEQQEEPYFQELTTFLTNAYQANLVYPAPENIFKALEHTALSETKVVILGQDPYHGPNQANGLSFSVPNGQKTPPSLRNIFKLLAKDLGVAIPESGDLSHWANQGVLMLNATLTVEHKQAGSHQKKGWETFTDRLIQLISNSGNDVVFLLWGSFAQAKSALIDTDKNHILTAVHPSPLSAHRGFFDCAHFSQTNQILASTSQEIIDWNLNNSAQLSFPGL